MFKGIRYFIVKGSGERLTGYYDDIGVARWAAFHLGANYRVMWELY